MKRRILLVFAMAMIYCQVGLVTACPAQSTIEKAAKQSNQLSILVSKAVDGTGLAYDQQAISLETKDKLVPILRSLNAGGETFNLAVKAAYEEYKRTGTAPNWGSLNNLFNDNVVTAFTQFLTAVKLVPGAKAEAMWIAIAAVRTAILAISSALGSNHTAKFDSIIPKTEIQRRIDYG